jgi:Uma2 family endonuclease
MNKAYEEIVAGESFLRRPPGERHERACCRLHAAVAACLDPQSNRLLEPRTVIELAPGTLIRPDLTLVALAQRRPWLIAEIIEPGGHHVDTVVKKSAYEGVALTRLWMVDLRYDNVEVYGHSPYGLGLTRILAQHEWLTESLLPGLSLAIADLCAA